MAFRIKNLFQRDKEERSVNNCNCNYYQDGLLFSNLGNQYSALNLAVAFRCVAIISQTIASLPFEVKDGDGEIIENHPISLFFNNKTDNVMSKYDIIKQLVTNILLQGNGYLHIVRGADNTPINLRYIQASDVTIDYKKETQKLTYRCCYINHGNPIDRKDMLHFKLYSYDGVNGISVLNYASRSIKNANLVEDAVGSYYKNGTMLNGVLSYSGNLSELQRNQIRDSWQATYGGSNGGVAVLGGNLQFQQLSSNAADAALNESREYSVNDIARFFGVPAILLGINGSSFSTFEAVEQLFLVNCIQPILEMLENEFNRKLFIDSDFVVDIDESSILRCDKSSQASYYGTLVDKGILTRNEVRTELGYKLVEGGDDLVIAYTDINQNKLNNNEDKENEE